MELNKEVSEDIKNIKNWSDANFLSVISRMVSWKMNS